MSTTVAKVIKDSRFSSILLLLLTLFLIYLNNTGKLKKIRGVIDGSVSLADVVTSDAMAKAGDIMDKTFPGETQDQKAAWGLPESHPKHPYNDPDHPSYRGNKGYFPMSPFRGGNKVVPDGSNRSSFRSGLDRMIGDALGVRRL